MNTGIGIGLNRLIAVTAGYFKILHISLICFSFLCFWSWKLNARYGCRNFCAPNFHSE
jgi:hypothetical protein